MNCVFCKIMNGEIPSYTVYEDSVVKVFLDIHPTSPGHLLIVPKVHTLDIDTIDDHTLMHVMEITKKMKKLLENALNADGISIQQNNGISQEIKHYHVHLKPCYLNQPNLTVEETFEKIKEFL